jgi:tetratricopeptide (TPR) repeat protein
MWRRQTERRSAIDVSAQIDEQCEYQEVRRGCRAFSIWSEPLRRRLGLFLLLKFAPEGLQVKLRKRVFGLLMLTALGTNLCKAQTVPDASPLSLGQQQVSQAGIDAGLAQMRAGDSAKALGEFEQVVRSDPNNATANLLAASAALGLYKGELAIKYAERALELDPKNWKIHTTLVAAYAGAGQVHQRDEERNLLRKLHDDPRAPDALKSSGFLLEMFPVKGYQVDAVEYFQPVGKFHIYYRFLVRNRELKRVWEIDAQSDDFNQKSWATAHPKEAKAGQRQFSLEGMGGGQNISYRVFSGDPVYDWFRGQVVKIVEAQAGPFPGEGTGE